LWPVRISVVLLKVKKKKQVTKYGYEIPIRSFDRKVRILYWVPP
jgi:hypothetical protein